MEKDGISVSLNMDSIQQTVAKLEKALVGKFIGKRLPHIILNNELKDMGTVRRISTPHYLTKLFHLLIFEV